MTKLRKIVNILCLVLGHLLFLFLFCMFILGEHKKGSTEDYYNKLIIQYDSLKTSHSVLEAKYDSIVRQTESIKVCIDCENKQKTIDKLTNNITQLERRIDELDNNLYNLSKERDSLKANIDTILRYERKIKVIDLKIGKETGNGITTADIKYYGRQKK